MLIYRKTVFISSILCSIGTAASTQTRTAIPQNSISQCIATIRSRPRAVARPLPMPSACYHFVQGSLNSPITGLFERLGTPDALSYSKGYLGSENGHWDKGVLEVSYVYPRDLNTELRRHPRAHVDYHVLNILAENGIIRAGRVMSFAGLSIGDSAQRVYRVIGKPSRKDKSGEILFYDPYPVQIQLDDAKRKVVDLSISTTIEYMNQLEAPGPFEIRNSAGKIVGIKLIAGDHR